MLIDPLSVAYLDHCESNGTPATTVRRRAAVLRSVADVGPAAGVATREDLEEWWSTRQTRAASTRDTDLACLRTFYRWARRFEHRTDDPTARIDPPRKRPGLPRGVSEADLGRLLERYRGERPRIYRAIVLGAYAGLRISETTALTWSDVDLVAGHITVTGKGDKTRRIPLAADVLEDLGTPPAEDLRAKTSVVTGGQQITVDELARQVNAAIRDAGVRGTSHQLRHRFGTFAYRHLKDLAAVRDLMGHASIQTTLVYAAAADDSAQSIAAELGRDYSRRSTPAIDRPDMPDRRP